MIDTRSVGRVLVLAAAIAACTAPTAAARVPDIYGHETATAPARQPGVPPRVDGMAVQPRERPAPAPVQITQPRRGGLDWRSAAITGTAVLGLALLALVASNAPARTRRHART
jgi:hypothetical protein